MLSVSELNEQAKSLLEAHFAYVEVRGEVSRLVRHASGHWYFTLKDGGAAISAVIYKANNAKLKFEVRDGMSVVLYGKVSIYAASGSYQLIAASLRPDGEGELETAFKQLKERLEREGLFDVARKKQIPKAPRRIALVTSATSAALQDMLKIARSRWKLTEILIFDALTQGENAPVSLIAALKKADACGADAVVLARGGGSREDLWCFNDEALARAIYAAKTPVISAIGHEIDYVISDFAADFRAPTPSAAINELMPDENAVLQYLDRIQDDMKAALNFKITAKKSELEILRSRFSSAALRARVALKFNELKGLKMQLDGALKNKILSLSANLKRIEAKFEAQEEFFEATKNLIQIRVGGKPVNLEALKIGDEIELSGQKISKKAKITS